MDENSSARKQTKEEFSFALECDEAKFIFKPISHLQNRKKESKKPKKKQVSLKTGFKNTKDKNSIPKKSHSGKTGKSDGCPHCNLAPCLSTEYHGELAGLCRSLDNPSNCEDTVIDKLQTRYRSLFAKQFGESSMIKSMPNNDSIPKCAKDATSMLYDVEILFPNYVRWH